MKKILLAAVSILGPFSAFAQTEVMNITLNNNETTSFPISDIKEITFGVSENDPAQLYAGSYKGTQSINVAGTYKYSTEVTYTLTKGDEGTINVSIPEYQLTGTMMGDLTLGALVINGLQYDKDKGGFYRDYSNDGLKQHFKAISNGQPSFDNDYVLGAGSTILITLENGTITVTNPFKLGAMPLPMVSEFVGSKQ